MHGESDPVTLLQSVDGSWSQWTSWSACSKTCLSKSENFGGNKQNQNLQSYSLQFFHRFWYSPKISLLWNIASKRWPSVLGTINTDIWLRTNVTQPMINQKPIILRLPRLLCEGNWESWSPWSPCSRSCGNGTSYRMRTCSDHHCKNFTDSTLPDIRTEIVHGGIRQITDRCNPQDCPSKSI